MPQTIYKPLEQPFTSYLPPQDPQKDDNRSFFESFGESIAPGFRQVNIISNMIELGQKKDFPEEPNFDLAGSMKLKGLWDTPDRDNYVGVRSNAELDYRAGRIAKQRKDQDTLARAGWGGYAAMTIAGLVDPTIFIPFLKAGSVPAAILKSGLLVGGTVAAEEIILQDVQETRTAEEGAYSVGAATILGGILGGAVHAIKPTRIDVQSPVFQEQFQGSKIVDASNKPLLLFHGTDRAFDQFKPDGKGIGARGIYFTEDSTLADMYATVGTTKEGSPNIRPAYLDIKKPLVVSSEADLIKAGIKNIDYFQEADIARLKAQGYDGVIDASNPKAKVYIAFEPKQVISAFDRDGLKKMADDMANPPRHEAISEPIPHWDEPSDAGAFQIRGEGGRLKSEKFTKPVIDKMSRLNPVTRLIQQDNAPSHMTQGSPLAREVGGKFSQAGLRLEGNIEGFSASPGGNIENVIKSYAGMLDDASRTIDLP
jgi:hypothetical protein